VTGGFAMRLLDCTHDVRKQGMSKKLVVWGFVILMVVVVGIAVYIFLATPMRVTLRF
jgi:uncharacterized PurR-regulated membrane protein YhhQ (DUF165 family)